MSGLVLADTRATADTAEGRAGRDRMVDLLLAEGPRGVAESILPRLLGETTKREQPDLTDTLVRVIESNTSDGLRAAILAMRDRPDSTPVLSSVTCPTAIICGAEDTVTPPADSESMHNAISGSRLFVLPRAGHISNLENATAFDEALASVVRGDTHGSVSA